MDVMPLTEHCKHVLIVVFGKQSLKRNKWEIYPLIVSIKTKPFKAIGANLIRPLMIKCGRSCVKRYLCIVNCLASRAVHFQVVQSLETSTFIQDFTRFCNRRNVRPTDVYSDNDGNFVAADRAA